MPYSNPYSSGAAFPNLSPQIMNFTDNLVRLKTHQEDIDMRGRQLQQGADQFNAELPIRQGQLDVQRGNLAETQKLRGVQEREQQFKEAAAPQRQNFDSISAGMITDALEKFGAAEKDFTDSIKKMGSTPGVTKQMALQEILTQYPNQRQQMIDDSVANLIKNKEKDPNYVNTPKGKAHQAFIGILDKDTTGESAFGNTSLFGPVIKAMKMEEAAKQKTGMDQVKAFIAAKALRGELLTDDEKALLGIVPKATNHRRKTREYEEGGKTWGQDYDFNPTDRTETPVGKPYLKSTPKPGAEGKLSDIEKQELIGVRSDLRTVNRELLEVRRNAGFGMEAAKGRLPLIEAEYNDLKAREKELLTKDTGSTTTTPAAKPKVNAEALLQEANQAIKRGADPAKVRQRLKDQYGITVK